MTEHKHTNRLIEESSPYLLQHAHNPVDWYSWSDEAWERARAEDKLVIISIGYSACHWCHVMEQESFENEQVAALMNKNYICIKVDREEAARCGCVFHGCLPAHDAAGAAGRSMHLPCPMGGLCMPVPIFQNLPGWGCSTK